MILGLIDSIRRGSMCRAIRVFPRVKKGLMLLI